MDYILDSSVFPTLPAGGSLSHADLMGRPRLAPTQPKSNTGRASHSKPHNPVRQHGATSLDGHGVTSQASSSSIPTHVVAPRPGIGLRRISSFSASMGNQAGIGAVGVGTGQASLPAHSLPARSGGRRGSIIGPDRPMLLRRRSSYEEGRRGDMTINQYGVGSKVGRVGFVKPSFTGNRHQRTASESTGSTIRHSPSNSSRGPPVPLKNNLSGSVDHTLGRSRSGTRDGRIRLGRPDQVMEISRLINTLHNLTPSSRVQQHTAPRAGSGTLHPSTIMTPLAIILEALVFERSILRNPEQAISSLPTLKDGSNLQSPEGGIDWTQLRVYTRSMGGMIDQILPYIQSSQDRANVEEMIRSVRMFVGKIKKVFAELVQGYGDGYGFLKGWWDDGDMKGCAGEIGRWCDLFDVRTG